MSIDKLREHRRIWARKPAFRRVYRRLCERVWSLCSPHRPIVELGCGAGLFREFYPDVIATDVTPTRWTNLACDASRLSFATDSVGNLVMIDVFHHLAGPRAFLAEAARVLKPGGRTVMLEPWTSWLGYRFYRYIHHESADYDADPDHPFGPNKHPFEGNAAMPRMHFGPDREGSRRLLRELGLAIVSVQPVPALGAILTGGFRPYGFTRGWMVPALQGIDTFLQPLSRWLGLRAFVVMEKTAARIDTRLRPAREPRAVTQASLGVA